MKDRIISRLGWSGRGKSEISFLQPQRTGESIWWRRLQSRSENGEEILSWNRDTGQLVSIEEVDRFGRPRHRRPAQDNLFYEFSDEEDIHDAFQADGPDFEQIEDYECITPLTPLCHHSIDEESDRQ